MNSILDKIRTNPVLATAFVSTVLTLVVSFGVHLSDLQTGAIIAVVNSVLAIVARSKVTPVQE